MRDAELAHEHGQDVVVHLTLDLETHRRGRTAPCQLALERPGEMLGIVLLDLEVLARGRGSFLIAGLAAGCRRCATPSRVFQAADSTSASTSMTLKVVVHDAPTGLDRLSVRMMTG